MICAYAAPLFRRAGTLHLWTPTTRCARTASCALSSPLFISPRNPPRTRADFASYSHIDVPFLKSDYDFAHQFIPPQFDYEFADMPKASKGSHYAVQKGRQTGVFNTWAECEAAIKGFPGAVYKKFPTRAQAQEFVRSTGYAQPSSSSSELPPALRSTVSRQPFSSTEPSVTSILGKRSSTSIKAGPSKRTHTDPVFPSVGGPSDKIIVYCDGSSISNGKSSARAGWGVYFPSPTHTRLSESRRLPGPVQTNNRAELMALIRAIQLAPDNGAELVIFSDSQYSMNAVSKWLPGWKRNGWKTATGQSVQNKDLILQLDQALEGRKPRPKLEYVKGHAGVEGNEVVDRMAKYGASLPEVDSKDLGRRSEATERHTWVEEELAGLDEKDWVLSQEERQALEA